MQLQQRHSFTLTKSVSLGFFKKKVQILTSSGESLKLHHLYGVPESSFQKLIALLNAAFTVIVVTRLRQFTCKSHSFQLEFVMKVRGGGFINAFDSPPLHLLSTSNHK